MKKPLLLLLAVFALLSMKEKPVIKINPDLLGSYTAIDTARVKVWLLKPHPDAVNKIDFYQATDKEPTFTVTMKDSTHFKTLHEFSHTTNQVTTYWTAKGAFIEIGKMEIAVQTSDVSAGLKISFSMEETPKVIYQKK